MRTLPLAKTPHAHHYMMAKRNISFGNQADLRQGHSQKQLQGSICIASPYTCRDEHLHHMIGRMTTLTWESKDNVEACGSDDGSKPALPPIQQHQHQPYMYSQSLGMPGYNTHLEWYKVCLHSSSAVLQVVVTAEPRLPLGLDIPMMTPNIPT